MLDASPTARIVPFVPNARMYLRNKSGKREDHVTLSTGEIGMSGGDACSRFKSSTVAFHFRSRPGPVLRYASGHSRLHCILVGVFPPPTDSTCDRFTHSHKILLAAHRHRRTCTWEPDVPYQPRRALARRHVLRRRTHPSTVICPLLLPSVSVCSGPMASISLLVRGRGSVPPAQKHSP